MELEGDVGQGNGMASGNGGLRGTTKVEGNAVSHFSNRFGVGNCL